MILKYFRNLFLFALFPLFSCSDMLDTTYTDGIDEENLENTIRTQPEKLKSVVNGLYYFMVDYQEGSGHDSFNYTAALHATDMMGQDIVMDGSNYFEWDYLHQYRLAPYIRTAFIWNTFYTIIGNGNKLLNLANKLSAEINAYSPDFYDNCLGQAYALRGMSYFYLIQLYQEVNTKGEINWDAPGVPILLSDLDEISPEEQDQLRGRNTVRQVLEQAEQDLLLALQLMEGHGKSVEIREVDENVVHGLLARYYMLTQEWQKAADHARLSHASYQLMNQDELLSGFMDANNEWMWGYRHTVETQSSLLSWFAHISNNSPGYAGIIAARLIDKQLYDTIHVDDIRRGLFNGPEGLTPENEDRFAEDIEFAPNIAKGYASLKFGKKTDWTQDYPYMRKSEMILIEAEAYAHLGQESKAEEVIIELLNNRIPDWDKELVVDNNGNPILDENGELIYKDVEIDVTVDFVHLQRRIELWGEGFSFFDNKRLYKGIDRSYKGSNHRASSQLVIEPGAENWVFQVPRREMQDNDFIDESEQND
ncbi:RagB/SusD family nutrient uptake outer membrane protein [Saccharicrinis aurantiacus]|uniref:RagB/SusD family nutrient uptake outer membrane protein n=1 Tax=Saccharicrinis aurantiacus TaxID=1849719 RepID=UPI00094F84D7|nr:RagB/SusD family nutrient uptake outer membrane protein [Saccharicrinis aurantiacus]